MGSRRRNQVFWEPNLKHAKPMVGTVMLSCVSPWHIFTLVQDGDESWMWTGPRGTLRRF